MSTTEHEVDRERVAKLLDGVALERLRLRLRKRIAATGALDGKFTLTGVTAAERHAVDGLLGRSARGGASVSFTVAEADAALSRAGIAPSLKAALEALEGPIELRGARDQARQRQADRALAIVETGGDEALAATLDESLHDGLLARLLGPELPGVDRLARQLVELAEVLRTRNGEISRAELAARITGDAHALDDAAMHPALRAVTMRYVARLTGSPPPSSAEEARAVFAAAGVEVDALAGSVLVLNLPVRTRTGPLGTAIDAHLAVGEPLRLTGRALRRHAPDFGNLEGCVVRVCENPSIVLAAARELGSRSAPLVCTEGQPSLAVIDLLAALTGAGAALAYHGDFDWPGVRIANAILSRYSATAWRMSTQDYLGARGGSPLGERPEAFEARWDPSLADAMSARGVAVHSESLIDALVGDLAH